MKATTLIKTLLLSAAPLLALVTPQRAVAQTFVLQLQATNYNATTGVWTATVGANATANGGNPTLTAGVSPNGAPAVYFGGTNEMALATSIAASSSYTAVAYVKQGPAGGTYALFGGASGAFEYRINANKQDVLKQQTTDLGSESTAMSTSAFSVIDCTVSGSGGGFRLNGVSDGNNAGSSFSQPISSVGARSTTGGENFIGYICEVDIYTGTLSPQQLTNAEAMLTAEYVTPPPTAPKLLTDVSANPSVATVGGNDTLSASFTGAAPLSYQWFISSSSSGVGATSITGATNTTLMLTNLQLANSGFYYSVRATNTVAPYSTNSSWLQLTVQPLTPVVQLMASNYNASSGVWTDSSGNNNNATYTVGAGSPPTPVLDTFVTPNGGPAVNITSGGGSFLLTSSLAQGAGYTVFAYLEPTNTSGRHAITGGSASTALEYDIYNGNQDYLTEYTADIGHGTATISTTNFSLVDLAVNSSGATFRLNGAIDASASGASFGNPISRIGNNEGSGDSLIGLVAEVDVYSGVLTYIQITNIEAQLTAKYVTANSIIIGAAAVSPTNNTFAGNPIMLYAPVIGASGSTTYRWQTDNGSGGTTWANITGATATNYVLNTSGLLGTYEYQLIGTPFGGNSITSAPVSLTVMAASYPVVASDTTPNPANATIGGNFTFSASFVGDLPIGYQWQKSSSSSGSPAINITGATNSTLTLSNLQLSDSGFYYSLRATNPVSPYVDNSSWVQLTVQPLTAAIQLVATNYSPISGVWTDSSGNGNNATYFGTASTNPGLAPFVTPNGSAAVTIGSGGGSFLLTSPLDQSVGYTVFAYLEPSTTTGNNAITGGSTSGALEYHVHSNQVCSIEYVVDVGHGAAAIPATNFSMVDLAVNSTGGAFRLNGVSDGNFAGATFTSPITRIGNNEGAGDSLLGQVAEIDVYSGSLSYLQITNIEAQLIAKYVTANSVIIGAATVSPTNNTFAGNAVTLSAPVIGATGTTSFQWQTDNGGGGATFSNIGGASTTNYNLNTSSLLGTYEYQLIATPFGGNSVTSAPVTLSVMAASAPVVAQDTTPNPATASIGGNQTFTASFLGNLPISYQWQVSSSSSGSGAVNIAGATNTTLVVSGLTLANSGYYYSLRATNAVSPYVNNSSWAELTVQALSPVLQLVATNYDPVSGTWTNALMDGNDAVYSGGTTPALVSVATPNGGSVVNIPGGGGSFVLPTPLLATSGYTVFAYIEPSSTTGRNALTGGTTSTALEYDIYNGKQDYLTEYTFDYGTGLAIIPSSSFSLIDLAVNSSVASFRFDGAPDGADSGANFGAPITRIGNNEGGGDSFVGNIAEIDIYSGALTYTQITNVEAQLMATYGAVSSVAINPTNIVATVSGTNMELSWPSDHTGWTLQAQTNSLSKGLGTNWVSVPNSITTNAVTIPIIPGNPTVFYRLKH